MDYHDMTRKDHRVCMTDACVYVNIRHRFVGLGNVSIRTTLVEQPPGNLQLAGARHCQATTTADPALALFEVGPMHLLCLHISRCCGCYCYM